MKTDLIQMEKVSFYFEKEYKELDELAELMLEPDENFEQLLRIWETKDKFRIMSGAMN